MQKEQAKIGYLIKTLREERGLTQKAFAQALSTSQSAVARMEAGRQNFTTGELLKISDVLNRKIISLDQSLDFEITGGRKLHGSTTTNSSKNGAMGLLCASLLNRGKTILHGIPRIEEVNRMIEVLSSIGVSIRWTDSNTLEIQPSKKLDIKAINSTSAGQTRSVIMMIGALIHHASAFSLPHVSGCKMGGRTIAAHKFGLEKLGAKILTKDKTYEISAKKLKPAEVIMYEASDTAAENLLIAAALIPGRTVLKFAPPNYQVQEVCFFLEKMGVKIDGIGTTTLTVHGVKEINDTIEYHNSEDPTESMMFMAAAIVTGSELEIQRCPIDFLELELLKLEHMGLKYDQSKTYLSYNGRTKLVDLKLYPSRLRAPLDKLHALPYPGINSDNLPFFVPIATQASGTTLIHDWMWENRAIYFTELNRLGGGR